MKTKERPDITALKERIKVAMAAKHEDAKTRGDLATIPTEEELDALVPGSAEVLEQAKAPKVRYPAGRCSLSQAIDQQLKMQRWYKETHDGIIGVTRVYKRFKVTFEQGYIGMYPTAIAAACAYNRAATEKYGDLAVLCDLDAAAKLDSFLP